MLKTLKRRIKKKFNFSNTKINKINLVQKPIKGGILAIDKIDVSTGAENLLKAATNFNSLIVLR